MFQGFFGKGSLSKSSPQFSKFGNTFDERCKSHMMKLNNRKCKIFYVYILLMNISLSLYAAIEIVYTEKIE